MNGSASTFLERRDCPRPNDRAKLIPAGSDLIFQMYYTISLFFFFF